MVTPCVGVWIEIGGFGRAGAGRIVTPCVGVWIEIMSVLMMLKSFIVTPCVGVWIEMADTSSDGTTKLGHSLRGSVD